MAKLLLISILIATVAVPARAARDPLPQRGARRVVVGMFLVNVAYLIFFVMVFPKL